MQTDANGLHHMRARYYNCRVLRFVNADPIGFDGGMNWYAAFGNNPISSVDPWGLKDSRDSGATMDPLYGGTLTVTWSKNRRTTTSAWVARDGTLRYQTSARSLAAHFPVTPPSAALSVVHGLSLANDVATVGGLILLIVAPPVGATVLTVTMIAGAGLGVTEGVMTDDRTKIAVSLAAPLLGAGAGRLGLRLVGSAPASFNRGAARYISDSTGRFIATSQGVYSVQVSNLSDTVVSEALVRGLDTDD